MDIFDTNGTFYIVGKDNCKWCERVFDKIVREEGDMFEVLKLEDYPFLKDLLKKVGLTTVPQVWYGTEFIGGYDAVSAWFEAREDNDEEEKLSEF